MYKGQRVNTPLGPGTVLGFETFLSNGQQGPLSDEDIHYGRAQVRLDTPENWLCYPEHGDPFMFRSNMVELNEEPAQ